MDLLETDTHKRVEIEQGANEVMLLGLVAVEVAKTLKTHKILLVVIHGTHAGTQVKRPGAGAVLVGGGNQVTVSHIGRHRQVEQPLAAEHPIVAVAH